MYRTGQPTLIGDLQHSTPTHLVIANAEGQWFRVPRTSVSDLRLGGVRTMLWSLLSVDGFLIGGPVGLVQWAGEIAALESSDGERTWLLNAHDEDEVVVDAEEVR